MRALILAALCLFTGSALAQWTLEQKKLAAIYLTAHAVDWGQTRTIAKNLHRWEEANPALGRRPSMARVNTHFIVGPLIGYAILDNVNSDTRTAWLRVLAQVQVVTVAHNAHAGISVSF